MDYFATKGPFINVDNVKIFQSPTTWDNIAQITPETLGNRSINYVSQRGGGGICLCVMPEHKE